MKREPEIIGALGRPEHNARGQRPDMIEINKTKRDRQLAFEYKMSSVENRTTNPEEVRIKKINKISFYPMAST